MIDAALVIRCIARPEMDYKRLKRPRTGIATDRITLAFENRRVRLAQYEAVDDSSD